MKSVSRALPRLSEWQNHSIKFLVFGPGLSHLALFGNELCTQLLQRPNVSIVDVDPWMANVRYNHQFSRLYSKVLIVPYIIRQRLIDTPKNTDRTISVMFHGDTGRYDGGRRGAVRDILTYIPNSEYKTTFHLRGNTTALNQVYRQTLDSMLLSRACMCPSGDTPTTRRIYESLASGCVPIRVDDIPDKRLPFPKLFNWSALSFRFRPQRMSLNQRHIRPSDDILTTRKNEANAVMMFLKDPRLFNMSVDGAQLAAQYINPMRPYPFIDAILMHWT